MKRGGSILLQELVRPTHYVVALCVGTVLTVITNSGVGLAFAPFVVPFLVSSVGRTFSRIAYVERERLLQLPAMRRSPAFVMARDGTVEATMGRTAELFELHGVRNVADFLQPPDEELDKRGADRAGEPVAAMICADDEDEPVLYSPVVERWYRVSSHCDSDDDSVLIWLSDVTDEREAELRRAAIRSFQIEVVEDVMGADPVDKGEERLARLILDSGYEAVLFARERHDGHLAGSAMRYATDGRLERSGEIHVPMDSRAPITRSRIEGRAIAARRRNYDSAEGFERAYPVAPEMCAFLRERVVNLANYHAGRTSIVAFNRRPELTRSDLRFLEAAADAAQSLFAATDIARDRDVRFIQAIHGLCASAEFSDEITGFHIWRVNAYAGALAEQLCPGDRMCMEIGQVAAAHDIGKVAIPELVHAPRRLTTAEFDEMKMHTVYGAQILDRMIGVSEVVDSRLMLAREIALNHHQRWDGGGYPGLIDESGTQRPIDSRSLEYYRALRPLRGEEIPLSARIVSVCDCYDALRSSRPYKRPFTHEEAVSIIDCDPNGNVRAVDRYGPEVADAWEKNRERFREIFETMSDGANVREAKVPGRASHVDENGVRS